MSFSRVLIIFLAALALPSAWAHEPDVHYDHISLSASATIEVPQDQLMVSVYALAESEDAQNSADTVNKRISKA